MTKVIICRKCMNCGHKEDVPCGTYSSDEIVEVLERITTIVPHFHKCSECDKFSKFEIIAYYLEDIKE
jgi:hypothetical protein